MAGHGVSQADSGRAGAFSDLDYGGHLLRRRPVGASGRDRDIEPGLGSTVSG